MFRSSDRGRFLSAHRMAMDAVFIALHVVLSLFSIYILGDQIKLSFASFPLLVASLLFGMGTACSSRASANSCIRCCSTALARRRCCGCCRRCCTH